MRHKCLTGFKIRHQTLCFHDGSPYHIETSPLICSTNRWAGYCMIGTSVMKVLIPKSSFQLFKPLGQEKLAFFLTPILPMFRFLFPLKISEKLRFSHVLRSIKRW